MNRKVRYQLFLDAALSTRFEHLAAQPGATKSGILAAALGDWLDRRNRLAFEDRYGPRLDRMSLALGRIERDLQILLETLALLVRYELAVHLPLSADDDAGRAEARARFESFIVRVARTVASGQRTFGSEDTAR